jgi:hypothetical protein
VSEVDARLEQLAHSKIGQCHDYRISFTGSVLRGIMRHCAAA